MMKKLFRAWVGAALVLIMLEPAHPQEGPTYASPVPGEATVYSETTMANVWAGVLNTANFNGGYIGGVWAVNRESVYSDGVVFRAEWVAGSYSPSVFTHGGSILLGYRKTVGSGWLTGYVGPAYETHEGALAGAALSGSRGGLKIALEYQRQRIGDFDFFGLATYSTIYDTVFAVARPGFWLSDNIVIGPDVQFYRNDAYRDYKLGGFLGISTAFGNIIFAGGYLDPLNSGASDGYYLSLGVNYNVTNRERGF